MTMPDVTKVQVLAVAQAVVAAAVAFGAPLSQHQQDSLLALAAIVAAILIPADVVIRGKRAANAAQIAKATRLAPAPPAFTVTHGSGTAASGGSTATVTIPPAKKKPGPKKKP